MTSVAIIGGGPAGLTTAYKLVRQGIAVTVLEADPEYPGGIARTVRHNGYRFDIGGHRFFSKSRQIEDLWTELLPGDMLERPRLSRIYYRRKFFSYPLRPLEALAKLGLLESALCAASYAKARLFPVRRPRSFEDWVTNQFGARLYGIFFKTYTEKLWGMSCKEISADWAAQRIKGLSLVSAVMNAFRKKRGGAVIKTLIDSFRYPRLGPGMMWEACARRIEAAGGRVLMGARAVSCAADGAWTIRHDGPGEVRAEHLVSSAPLRELAAMLRPALSEKALAAARSLRYRDFLTVAVMLRQAEVPPDNWIYIHEPKLSVGRIQNFRSWSPELVPDATTSCYGLEYFCDEGDATWSRPDAELAEIAARELEAVGLGSRSAVVDARVVRQPKAYPVYDADYARNVAVLREELAARFPTLHLVGRNGMHRYNNQDHSMMTGILTAENILAGAPKFDVWRVNEDAEYHEAGTAGAV